MPTPLTRVKGIGPASAEKLTSAGIPTAEALAAATPEQVAAVPGFGPLRAGQILENARLAISAIDQTADIVVPVEETEALEEKRTDAQKDKTTSKKKAGKKKKTKSDKKAHKKKKSKQKKEKQPSSKDKKNGAKKKAPKKKKK
ncbi:uncharacterized protein Dvar_21940 [Desulfosarcina variabilis str. Montpellier]|uniref:helix-hairpin-helix domain-containing protein n=1 Tax=Desulfosarcina variabilis TaxID=2300 RepID=UPI003AFB262A